MFCFERKVTPIVSEFINWILLFNLPFNRTSLSEYFFSRLHLDLYIYIYINSSINFKTSYRREMKLVPIDMDYRRLQCDAFKFFLGVRLHGGSLPNFNFFNINPQNLQRNRKVHLSNCLDMNFHNISDIILRVFRRRNYD